MDMSCYKISMEPDGKVILTFLGHVETWELFLVNYHFLDWKDIQHNLLF